MKLMSLLILSLFLFSCDSDTLFDPCDDEENKNKEECKKTSFKLEPGPSNAENEIDAGDFSTFNELNSTDESLKGTIDGYEFKTLYAFFMPSPFTDLTLGMEEEVVSIVISEMNPVSRCGYGYAWPTDEETAADFTHIYLAFPKRFKPGDAFEYPRDSKLIQASLRYYALPEIEEESVIKLNRGNEESSENYMRLAFESVSTSEIVAQLEVKRTGENPVDISGKVVVENCP